MQKSGYVANGTALWLTVVLILNYVSLLESRFKPGFGSACVLKYKQCIKSHKFAECAASLYNCGDVGSIDYRVFRSPKIMQEVSVRPTLVENFSATDNQANRNMCIFNAKNDEKLCRVLCKTDSFGVQMENECREICRIASDLSAFDDCPFEKNCPSGCPCPKYDCKKNFYPAETTMILTRDVNSPKKKLGGESENLSCAARRSEAKRKFFFTQRLLGELFLCSANLGEAKIGEIFAEFFSPRFAEFRLAFWVK